MLLDEACSRLSLVGTAFLYQAAPHTGPTDYVWGDMDFVEEQQELKCRFMHDAATLKQCSSHYFDTFCGSATTAKKALKQLKPASPVVLALTTAAAGKHPAESVESQLRRVASLIPQNSKPLAEASAMDLLLALEEALASGEPGYYFDYIAFSHKCRQLQE